jgi:pilus assembly protein Flp/PilA
VTTLLARFLADKSGATAIEYALIAVGVAVAVVATVNLVGSALEENFYARIAEGFN